MNSSKYHYFFNVFGWLSHISRQWRRNEFESWGAHTEIIFVVPLHFFGSKSTISHFGERFCDGQYSLVSFLFAVLLLTVPPPVKVGWGSASASRTLWSRRQCLQDWTSL